MELTKHRSPSFIRTFWNWKEKVNESAHVHIKAETDFFLLIAILGRTSAWSDSVHTVRSRHGRSQGLLSTLLTVWLGSSRLLGRR